MRNNFNKDWFPCDISFKLFPCRYLYIICFNVLVYHLTSNSCHADYNGCSNQTCSSNHCPITLQEAFCNEILIMVKKKKTVEMVIDEGWHSESELKELGWSQSYPQNFFTCKSTITNLLGNGSFLYAHCCPIVCSTILLLNSGRRSMVQRLVAWAWVTRTPGKTSSLNWWHLICSFLWFPIYVALTFSLPQCRRNAYDGELEYWVVLRETGKRTEQSSYEHLHQKRQKAY